MAGSSINRKIFHIIYTFVRILRFWISITISAGKAERFCRTIVEGEIHTINTCLCQILILFALFYFKKLFIGSDGNFNQLNHVVKIIHVSG